MIINKPKDPLFEDSIVLRKMNIVNIEVDIVLKTVGSPILQTPHHTIFQPHKPVSKLIDFTKFGQDIQVLTEQSI